MVSVTGAASIASNFSGAASSASNILGSVQSVSSTLTEFASSITSILEPILRRIEDLVNIIPGVSTGEEEEETETWAERLKKGLTRGGHSPLGMASGGPVSANVPYIVGEKGPELFVPNTSGQIEPNDAITKRRNRNQNEDTEGRGLTFNMTFNLSGITDRTDKRALAKEIAGLIQQETRLTMGTGKARGRYL